MSEIDAFDNSQWKCLVHVSKLLFEGKIELKQLMNEIKGPDHQLADHLPRGFKIKGKRSPRKKKVAFVLSPQSTLDAPARSTAEKSGLKLIFKINLGRNSSIDCTTESVSKKITMKTPSLENLDKIHRKRRINSEEGEGASKKRVKRSSVIMDRAPDLPEAFKIRILGTGGDLESVVLVMQKELTKSDLSKGHGRLSMHYSKVRNEFLKPSEVDQLDRDKGGINVALIEPCLEECEISLRNWKSNSEYVLVRDWNKVCSRNALTEGMKIQLWSFRRNSYKLCLALVKVE